MSDKKYHLFCFEEYYPGGGLSDYIGSYELLHDIEDELNKEEKAGYGFTQADGTLVDRTYIRKIHSSCNHEIVVVNPETGELEEVTYHEGVEEKE